MAVCSMVREAKPLSEEAILARFIDYISIDICLVRSLLKNKIMDMRSIRRYCASRAISELSVESLSKSSQGLYALEDAEIYTLAANLFGLSYNTTRQLKNKYPCNFKDFIATCED